MGMYDTISAPAEPCEATECEGTFHGWQSKDGPCQLETLPIARVGNYYTGCSVCMCWAEYTLRDDQWVREIDWCRGHPDPHRTSDTDEPDAPATADVGRGES